MRLMRLRVLALLGITFLAACTRETPQPPAPPAKPAVVESGPHDGGRIVRRIESDIATLSYIHQTTDDERQFFAYIYDPLIELDRNLTPMPGVAEKWEIADGGLTYLLHLDPRANFSDGTPVTAADVVFTLKKIAAESPQFSSWFDTLDAAKTVAVDPHTARVVFKEARAPQLLSFNIGVLPEHVYGKENLKKTKKLVGNGPYVMQRRELGKTIVLERRENYWRTKPHIKTIVLRPIPDDVVAWKAVVRGDVDVARVNNDFWWRVKDDPDTKAKIDFKTVWLLSYNAVLWNLSDPLFEDVRVRRALAMCFDRQAVIDRLYHGQARAVSGPFTPDQWANNPDITPIEFNPQGAAALLASAGWRDSDGDGVLDRNGKKFTFRILVPSGNAVARDHAQVLQDALKRVGVIAEIQPADDSAFYDYLLNRNYQAAYTGWFNDPDPDPYSMFHSSQFAPEGMNVVGYHNAEADELIVKGRQEFDRTRRAEIYHQLHEVMARDQPYLWTVQVASKWAVNRRVKNVETANGLGLFLWYPGPFEWWVEK